MKNKLFYGFWGAGIIAITLACGGSSEPTEPTEPVDSMQQCGGFAGLTCDDPDEVCIVDDGTCGWADQMGTCQHVPEFCTEQYEPVCGCDGKTYSNDCFAKAAGASVDHAGECQSAGQVCGTRGAPQCGAGTVCIRPESASCGRFDAPGTCQVPPQICTREYMPVCGCDGQTYSNECNAHGAGTSVDYQGPCQPADTGQTCGTRGAAACGPDTACIHPESANCGRTDLPGTCQPTGQFCPQNYDPVCGCDGNTYSNGCMANSAGISVDYQGPCNATR